MIPLKFEPLQSLFEDAPGAAQLYDPTQIKHIVFEDAKTSLLTGTPDSKINVDFSPVDGSDIVIKSVDPEKALGYSLYADTQGYYLDLGASLHTPEDTDLLGGINV